jgi:hypothetical protein
MASAKFLQHGREICFSFSCVYTAHGDRIEINYGTEKCQFYILPPSAEERVKECPLFRGAYRGIRELR